MANVLFVDDDQNVLNGLRRLLYGKRGEWDMTFANGGQQALDHLAAEPVDVLVTDMRMPGVDGPQLLEVVRAEHPQIVRIVLSGHTELEATMRGMALAHQFLHKPCDQATLAAVVDRAAALAARLEPSRLRRALGRLDTLPSPSQIVLELRSLLAASEPDLDRIAGVISNDVGMSAKVLQLANSAFVAASTRIDDVRTAVVYLGFDLLRNLVVAADVFRTMESRVRLPAPQLAAIQSRGVEVAELAARLAPPAAAQEAFVSGLLHDVGVLALAASGAVDLTQIIAEAEEAQEPIHVVEERLLGADHAAIGGYVLALWGLPYGVVEAVAHHHQAVEAPVDGSPTMHAVHVASALLAELGGGAASPWSRSSVALDDDYLDRVGLAGAVAAWRCDQTVPVG